MSRDDGDICNCGHGEDWHYDPPPGWPEHLQSGGCNADNDIEDKDALRCQCRGFKIMRTAAANRTLRAIHARLDHMQDDEDALKRMLAHAERILERRERVLEAVARSKSARAAKTKAKAKAKEAAAQ